MNQALRPEFFANLPTIKEKKVTSGEEQSLFALSQTSGWEILNEYAQGLLQDLDKVTDTAMQQGMSFEEIGRNAIVANLAKGVIIRIIQKVEDAREAVDHGK